MSTLYIFPVSLWHCEQLIPVSRPLPWIEFNATRGANASARWFWAAPFSLAAVATSGTHDDRMCKRRGGVDFLYLASARLIIYSVAHDIKSSKFNSLPLSTDRDLRILTRRGRLLIVKSRDNFVQLVVEAIAFCLSRCVNGYSTCIKNCRSLRACYAGTREGRILACGTFTLHFCPSNLIVIDC